MKKIRIAQIGTSENSHGNDIWNTLKKLPDDFEIVGYALPEREREKFPWRMKDFEGYPEMSVEEILSDPTIDAVTVETEEIYLTKYALMAAEANKQLHMEKPGGFDYKEFCRLIDTLKAKKLVFSVGYMYRFNPTIREAIDKVKRGELGRIFSVEAHMSIKHRKEVRAWLSHFPDGMLSFLGCHLIDLIYTMQGEPEAIIPLSCSTGIDGLATTDYGMVVYQYPNGVSFAKTTDNEIGGFMRRQLVVTGEKGTIEIRPLEIHTPEGIYNHSSESYADGCGTPTLPERSAMHDRYLNMMENFAEMIRGKENPYTYDYELGLYELILRSCRKEITK